ncbi:hypothetical protein SCUP234_05777 [Seiridium cupressi]
MSALTQALAYITGLFTPMITSEITPSESQTGTGFKQPIEASYSYFPPSASRRSSISSSSTGSQDSSPDIHQDSLRPGLVRSYTGVNPLDAMLREYPKPTQDIDVAKQLALEPRKHSLHHSLKRAATNQRAIAAEDAETKAKKLAAAKAELLALAGKA